jgi:hypothetical protein
MVGKPGREGARLSPRQTGASVALNRGEQFIKTRPPLLGVMGRRGELGARCAAASGKIHTFGVEPDRPPCRTQSLAPRKARERRLAQPIHVRDEPFLSLGQGGFALARDEDFGR